MLTIIKKLTVVALILAFAAPAAARVTPAHKYKQGEFTGDHTQLNPSIDEPNFDCSGSGWYEDDDKPAEANCTKKSLGSKTCWACECNTTKFPYADCPADAFTPGKSCSANGKTYYETCSCKSPYKASTDFSGLNNFNTGTAKTAKGISGNTLLTCYRPDNFACKSGSPIKPSDIVSGSLKGSAASAKFKAKNDSPFLEYDAIAALNNLSASDNLFCTTGVTLQAPLYASRPAGSNECASFQSGKSSLYYPYKTYGYFDGNCSSSGKCVSQNAGSDCVIYGGTAVSTYNAASKTGGSVTCKYTQGCETKVTTANGSTFLCVPGTVNPSGSYYSYTTITSGDASCKKVTGCAAGYTQKHLGAVNSTDYSKDGTNTYEVQKLTSGSGMIVCVKASGCAAPLYSQQACYMADGKNYGPPSYWTAANLGL